MQVELIVPRKRQAQAMKRWLYDRSLISRIITVTRANYEVRLEVPGKYDKTWGHSILRQAYEATL